MRNYPVVGNLYALTKASFNKELVSEITDSTKDLEGLEAGITVLPYDSGTMTRILGQTADEVKAAIYRFVNIIRKTVIGAPFSGIRKY